MTKYQFSQLSTEWPEMYQKLRWQQYKQTLNRKKSCAEKIVCAQRRKQTQTKRIFTSLFEVKGLGPYRKEDIDKAIMVGVDVMDVRSIKNWFNFLWTKQYLVQPIYGVYELYLDRITELELDMGKLVSGGQRRLFNV